VLVEALVTQLAVETLDVAVLLRLAGRDEAQLHRDSTPTGRAPCSSAPARVHDDLLGHMRKQSVQDAGLWDIETGRPVAAVPGERKADVHAILELHGSRRTVQAVCIDLSEARRQHLPEPHPDQPESHASYIVALP